MAKPSLDEIYSRLRQIPGYHPLTATTYADWSMEAGDSIEIERDGTLYRTPVGNTTVRWNGSQRVDIRTEGNKERESIARMSVDKYMGDSAGGGGGSAGIRNAGEIHNYVENLEEQTWSKFDQTDRAISAEVSARTEQGRVLTGKIEVEAGRISAVVTENGQIRAGMIVDAINKDSSVLITADKIVLSGTTTINDVMKINGGSVYINKPLYVTAGGRNVLIQGGYVRAYDVYVDAGARKLNVADVTVNGNVLTITYANGARQDFSKATSLTGAWSGSVYSGKVYKVEARQPGSSTPVATHSSPVVGRIDTDYYYMEGNTPMLMVTVKDAASTEVLKTGVNATDAYNAGAGSVTPDRKTQYNPMYCTSAVPQGGGETNYKFEATLPSGRFSSGSSYDFWRIP